MKTTKIFLVIAMLLAFGNVCFAGTPDGSFHAKTGQRNNLYHPDKTGDTELRSLINESLSKFQLETFHDDTTGLELQYNICFPDGYGYSSEERYPVIFFIADASAAGKEAAFSITQGYGALVWEKYKCIVIVPFYPEVILDDHNGFVMSDYVSLTGRFIRHAKSLYNIDTSRVYGTGQSMGCMTLLYLAANNQDLFTACLFVSGQWDVKQLRGLETQRFIYVASSGDDKASTGQREVMDMFRSDGVGFDSFSEIDAKEPDLSIQDSQSHTFITFKKGSTLPEGTQGDYSEHMSSFDYAYRIKALRDWLFAQNQGL